MASSSSSLRNWRFNVFTSFHGPDVRQGLLSHIRQQFTYNGITMFDDQEMVRGDIISPTLIEAIRDSRIAIVLLSKNYASSSWCLDELLEILECKEKIEPTVMTIFYGVDPSHVRHQTGDFGMAFSETCARKTEHKRKWSEALTYVGNIAGEDFKNWDNEAKMIEKIARDVSDKLNDASSRDSDGMVGLEHHLTKTESLLDLDNVGVKIVAISGPAGIGKSTIAEALHSRLYRKFQHHCYVDNHVENFKNYVLGSRNLKLGLQEQILSKMLNQQGIQINHTGVIERRLNDKKVLLTVDDVENIHQLEALANIEWFGPGSRVIVSTENKEILQQHDINDIYEVDFPSRGEAQKIFCLSAFKKTSPPNEFMNLVAEVARICGNLPLGMHVLGSSLRGKSKAYWIKTLPWLKNSLDGRIESVLKVGYESLDEKHQVLFILVAVFFDHQYVDNVTSILSNTNVLDVSVGLENLANRYLIQIKDIFGKSIVEIHQLLKVMARQVISKQDPWKRQILVDGEEICEVLESAAGNRSVVGVSFDVTEINELIIHPKAFERMRNLSFLKVYNLRRFPFPIMKQIQIPEEMEFPRRIRLFHWDAYLGKSLHRFVPENLVELNMVNSQLEKLWEGRQPLPNLKWMNLCHSSRLKELPDLINATNLEKLDVSFCTALVELPSSIVNLHKLHRLYVDDCKRLEVIPTLANLPSLVNIPMEGCSQLKSFPDITSNSESIKVIDSGVEELPASLRQCCRMEIVLIRGNKNLKTFSTHLPTSVTILDLRDCGIERITDCIKGLHNLKHLDLSGCERLESLPELPISLERLDLRSCKRLVSLPQLPDSLQVLRAVDCESLERVSGHLNTPKAKLDFTNCLKLDRQAQQTIIQQLFACGVGCAFLPGREVPAEFDHRATGNSLTIPHSAFNRFKVCVVISYTLDGIHDFTGETQLPLQFYIKVKGYLVKHYWMNVSTGTKNAILFRGTKHLIIFESELPFLDPSEVSREINLKFRNRHQIFSIIECGVQILSVETDRSNYSGLEDTFESGEASSEEEDDVTDRSNNGGFGDIFDKIFGSLYEPKASDEPEEDDDSIIANGRSETEFGDVSDKEDNEEGYKSDYGEASKDKDKDTVDEATNGQKEDDDEGYKSDYGEASKDFSFCLIKRDIADDEDNESVSRKCPKIFHFF